MCSASGVATVRLFLTVGFPCGFRRHVVGSARTGPLRVGDPPSLPAPGNRSLPPGPVSGTRKRCRVQSSPPRRATPAAFRFCSGKKSRPDVRFGDSGGVHRTPETGESGRYKGRSLARKLKSSNPACRQARQDRIYFSGDWYARASRDATRVGSFRLLPYCLWWFAVFFRA